MAVQLPQEEATQLAFLFWPVLLLFTTVVLYTMGAGVARVVRRRARRREEAALAAAELKAEQDAEREALFKEEMRDYIRTARKPAKRREG